MCFDNLYSVTCSQGESLSFIVLLFCPAPLPEATEAEERQVFEAEQDNYSDPDGYWLHLHVCVIRVRIVILPELLWISR